MKLLLALLSLFPAVADAAPPPLISRGDFLPWLVVGLIVIAAAAAVFIFLKKKKKR